MACIQPIQYSLHIYSSTSSLPIPYIGKCFFRFIIILFYLIYAPSNFRHSSIFPGGGEKKSSPENIKFNRQLFDRKIRVLRLTRIFTHWFFFFLANDYSANHAYTPTHTFMHRSLVSFRFENNVKWMVAGDISFCMVYGIRCMCVQFAAHHINIERMTNCVQTLSNERRVLLVRWCVITFSYRIISFETIYFVLLFVGCFFYASLFFFLASQNGRATSWQHLACTTSNICATINKSKFPTKWTSHKLYHVYHIPHRFVCALVHAESR